MKILITGAAGRTSGFVLKALLNSSHAPSLRLFVRSEAAIQKLQSQYPYLEPSDFALGDYLEASTLPPALEGVDIVFHNGPVFHPNETAMGIALIDAAKKAGVKHFVYCSVLYPILTKMLNHEVKRVVEEYLIESGMNYTILEPSAFMQNVNLQFVLDKGKVPAIYSPNTLQGYLDLEDLAEVARNILLDPAPHNRARYELLGQNHSFADVARDLSAHLGKTVDVESVPREQVLEEALRHVQTSSDYYAEAFDRMLYYCDKRGIPGNNNVLRWLLGHEPTTWKELIKRELRV